MRSCGANGAPASEAIERLYRNAIQHQAQQRGGIAEGPEASPPIVIPVIFHLFEWPTLANPTPSEVNPQRRHFTQAEVQAQLDVLNADFQGLNADLANVPSQFQAVTGRPNIRFCLATRDDSPQEQLLTEPGIKRHDESGVLSDYYFNYLAPRQPHPMIVGRGGFRIWSPDKYLNIYVCNLNDIAGAGMYPANPLLVVDDCTVDGVAIKTECFGPNARYGRGRALTHEVGHFLGLFHTFGKRDEPFAPTTPCTDSDEVSDTPMQTYPSQGCPWTLRPTNCQSNEYEMYMNFMDYADDQCRYMFTKGQVQRMNATFQVYPVRGALLNSLKAAPDVHITHNLFSTRLCPGNRATGRFKAVNAFCGAARYSWTVPPTWAISDSTAAEPIITPDGVNGGTVWVKVTYFNGTARIARTDRLVFSVPTDGTCEGNITGPSVLCPGQFYQFAANPALNGPWTTSPSSVFDPNYRSAYGSTFTTQVVSSATGYATITITYINLPSTPSVSRTVQVGPPDSPSLITSGPEPCQAASQQFTIVGFDPTLSYTIHSNYATQPSSLGANTFNPNRSFFSVKGAPGTGWVYVVATNACGSSPAPANPEEEGTIFDLPTCNGPGTVYPKQGAALYPNPASEQVTLSEDVVSVQVVNSYGNPVPTIRHQRGQLNVRQAAAGLYHVRMVMRDGSVKTQQLQVVH